MKKIRIFILTVFLMTVCSVSVSAQDNIDITQTGIDLLTNPPKTQTVYIAGEGTVTYTPGTDTSPSVIVFDNATINGVQNMVNYWSNNYATAALIAEGDTDIILKGNSEIAVSASGAGGLFFYDSNVTIKGDGNLIIDNTASASSSQAPGNPIEIEGDNDNYYDKGSGNLLIESGNIELRAVTGWAINCMRIRSNFNMTGGSVKISGGSMSILTVLGEMNIEKGKIECSNSSVFGMYSYAGDINISNGAQIDMSKAENDIFCIATGRTYYNQYGEKEFTYADISIDNAVVKLGSSMGIYTENGGKVSISGSDVDINVNDVGIWSSAGLNISGSDINIGVNGETGSQRFSIGIYCTEAIVDDGNIHINVYDAPESSKGITMGIYAENLVQVNGGILKISSHGSDNQMVSGIYSDLDKININGGLIKLQSSGSALSAVPGLDGYPLYKITAGLDYDGVNIEEYNPENIQKYKYFNLIPEGINVDFENGKAQIWSDTDVKDVTVIFAAYDMKGVLKDCCFENTDIKIGSNIVEPGDFDFADNNIRVLLWSDFNSMTPVAVN